MNKSNIGRFLEDYSFGEVIAHTVPRTLTEGERALYPARHALNSSDEFARNCGLPSAPVDYWDAFHMVFGKTVLDISLNAVANLGYAEGRWLAPIFTGDTVQAVSEVIKLKENTNGKTGIVYLRTRGVNQHGDSVLEYVRWAMLSKRQISSPAPQAVLPKFAGAVDPADLCVPQELDFSNYAFDLAGEPAK